MTGGLPINHPLRRRTIEGPSLGIHLSMIAGPLPCLGVAGAASRRLWRDGEPDPERPQHLHHRADAGVALAGQCFVQAGPA